MTPVFRVGLIAAVACAVLGTSGCGNATLYPVAGIVKFKGKPVEGCKVSFVPDAEAIDPEYHGFGFGVTDKEGKFVIQHPQGEKGIRAGKYRVGFSCWVATKTGKPVPFDGKPSEIPGGVTNIFGDKYEDASMSPEKVEVPRGGLTDKVFDITP